MKKFRKIDIENDVLPKLNKVKRSGKGYSACCPAHSDTNPSLSINQSDDGKLLLRCHAQQCEYENILKAIDLYEEPKVNFSDNLLRQSTGQQTKKIVAEYNYTDEYGKIIYTIVRFEPKNFRPKRPDGYGGWLWNLQDVEKVPYRLCDLIQAKTNGSPVFICEGEKDADNINKTFELTATTTAFGAKSWNDNYAEFFDDLDVVILPDNDESGRNYANQIALSIWGRAKSVKVIQLPSLPEKGDVSDWIEQEGSREKLLDLVANVSEWNPDEFQENGSLENNSAQPSELALYINNELTNSESVNEVRVDFLINAKLTDTGNAECFAYEVGNDFRYNKTNKEWHIWNGIVWKQDKTGTINSAILQTIRNKQRALLTLSGVEEEEKKSKAVRYMIKCEDVSRRTSIKAAAEMMPQFITTAEQYDADKYLIGTQNGTLNLHDGRHDQSRREDLLSLQMGTKYNSETDCPRWKQFLQEIFDGDEELIHYIQKLIGYSLTGDISEQKMFILYGYGNNGKSVFLRTIDALLGDYSGTATFKTFEADKKNEQTNDLAMLKGKRFVSMSEAAADRRLNEPLIKQVTGEDVITCRLLYKEFFQYIPQFKLFLATNHKPVITQSDKGIWRRIVLIPFTQNFTGREDKELKDKLLTELPGILNWAIEGLKKWRDERLENLPKAVLEATEKYKKDSDTVGQWLELKTVKDANNDSIKASDAYNDYKNWAQENGHTPLGNRTFKASLEERGYVQIKKSDANYWQGINFTFRLS